MKAQKLNRRQVRWALYLSRFNFTLKYVPETKMGKTDRLSKRLDWKVEVEKDNDNQLFIKDYQLYSLSKVVIEGLEVDIVEKIKIARNKDKEVVRVVEEMKKVGIRITDSGLEFILFSIWRNQGQGLSMTLHITITNYYMI